LRRSGFNLDFIGIGAARSGTSWVARCLREHPAIFLPERKELHFFNDDRKYDRALSWLKPFYEKADPNALWGEYTPRYIIDETALERIRAAFPEIRMLVMLRDPVDRAYSQYCYFRFNKKKEDCGDFLAALDGFYKEDYVVKSLYHEQLRRVFELFGRDRTWIGLFDDIRSEPVRLIRGLYRFLGVDDGYTPPAVDAVVNRSHSESASPPFLWARTVRWITYSRLPGVTPLQRRIMPRIARINRWMDEQEATGRIRAHRPLAAADRQKAFATYFRDDLESTEALLGLDLSKWKHLGSS
jgi:hypothetical protein